VATKKKKREGRKKERLMRALVCLLCREAYIGV
jgi:hypothetical protein